MEYVGVKVFIILGMFTGMVMLAHWAVRKLDEYFDDDE
tara:strand:- start:290 stop:403 length:114 start_codon:yes stop_codon:yes gene_type:complete